MALSRIIYRLYNGIRKRLSKEISQPGVVLDCVFRNGQTDKYDYEQTADWYRQAADQGHLEAAEKLK